MAWGVGMFRQTLSFSWTMFTDARHEPGLLQVPQHGTVHTLPLASPRSHPGAGARGKQRTQKTQNAVSQMALNALKKRPRVGGGALRQRWLFLSRGPGSCPVVFEQGPEEAEEGACAQRRGEAVAGQESKRRGPEARERWAS